MLLVGWNTLFTAMLTLMHPFFVSVIDINHNEKEATIEISVRCFTNDLEKMIAVDTKTTIDLSQPSQKIKGDALLKAYLTKRLNLSVNGNKSNLEYLGFEIQKESTWSYFEIKQVKQLKQLNIFCEILFGVDPNQINIIHVSSGGQRKSYELATPKNSTQFNF